MSRSRPNVNTHPCQVWMEWNGETGVFSFWDKEKEERMIVGNKFAFAVLDRTATITGWDDKSESRFYSNEIRSTKDSELHVKSFKGGDIVSGFYANIRESLVARGAAFTMNLYVAASKESGGHTLMCIQMKGAALAAWMDFEKKNRKAIYEKGVRVNGSDTAVHGRIEYHFPLFEVAEISPETNAAAVKMDEDLQVFLDAKTKSVKQEAEHGYSQDVAPQEAEPHSDASAVDSDSDIDDLPF